MTATLTCSPSGSAHATTCWATSLFCWPRWAYSAPAPDGSLGSYKVCFGEKGCLYRREEEGAKKEKAPAGRSPGARLKNFAMGDDEPQTVFSPSCHQQSGIRATYENLFADDLTCKHRGAQVELERDEN